MANTYTFLGLSTVLRALGVLGDKHVPLRYLRASREQRLALLQGLMDADGTVTQSGSVEFTTTRWRLAQAAHELIVSLGWKARIVEGRARLNGRDCGPKWDITWTPNEYVFRLERQISKQRLATRRTTRFRYVVRCDRIDPVPMRCITVENPMGLYLAGRSMVPTHNTFGLLLDPMRFIHIRGYGAVVLRRTYPDITREGGLWDEAANLYPLAGGTPRESPLEYSFPSGAKVTFHHMHHAKDRFAWKGAQIPTILWDQLEEFEAVQFWYLFSRNRSTCGVRPYQRATVNPPEQAAHWIYELLGRWVLPEDPNYPTAPGDLCYFTRDGDTLVWVDAHWRDPDGQPATSITFIPATIYDNPALLSRDPGYLAKLRAMPLVDRERLLHGNWTIQPKGRLLPREWFKVVPEAPAGLETVGRSWDEAATEDAGDWSAGARVGFKDGVWYILDMVRGQWSPHHLDRVMSQVAAADGAFVPIHLQQEPGSAGVARIADHRKRLKGHIVRSRQPTGDKVTRAKPLMSAAEAGNVCLVAGPWNEAFLRECDSWRGSDKDVDDQIDAVSWAILEQSHTPRGDQSGVPAGMSLAGGFGSGSSAKAGSSAGRYGPGNRGGRYGGGRIR